MSGVRRSFEGGTILLPLDRILPTRQVSKTVRLTPKYRTILASIREVGIIEPLAVHPEQARAGKDGHYVLLDGHLRLEALKELGSNEAVCLVSTDDEGFTYNKRISRLSAVQEHLMILRAIEKGLAPERIAQALNVNVDRIRERQRLLEGIAPEVVEMLKDRMVGQKIFAYLRKMKPMRQIAAAEMMISANHCTEKYARMILVTSKPDDLVEPTKAKPTAGVSPEDIARMEREMEKLQRDYRLIEDNYGDNMLTLVVAKGFVGKLLANPEIATHLDKHHGDLVAELRKVVEAVAADAPGTSSL
jgi:RepB plasmid partitioning protein/ParB-like nuclease domain